LKLANNNNNKFVEEMSCPAGPPPDYETVVKQREEEENGLPTYSVVSIYIPSNLLSDSSLPRSLCE
jgi:hypothetical protein